MTELDVMNTIQLQNQLQQLNWKGETVVIIGTGPSLNCDQLEMVYMSGVKTITVNDAIYRHPVPDIMYACDKSWWDTHYENLSYEGLKLSLDETPYPDVYNLPDGGKYEGLALEPYTVNRGHNSVYQCINLCVHLGVAKIVLIGVDMKRASNGKTHCFGDHPSNLIKEPVYDQCLLSFNTLPAIMDELGIEIINATSDTDLVCFTQKPLMEALNG